MLEGTAYEDEHFLRECCGSRRVYMQCGAVPIRDELYDGDSSKHANLSQGKL